MPGIFHQSGCCGGQPCVDCGGSQPDIPQANVSVSGSCDSVCATADDGDYQFQGFVSDECYWYWYGPQFGFDGTWEIRIQYHPSEGRWEAWLQATQSEVPNHAEFHSSNVSGISCNSSTGHLEGTFTLDGVDSGTNNADCSGCTATITLTRLMTV